MKNYLITLMYDGTNFHGWQVQDNAVTVQETLQDAIQRILSKRENIIGCSRTDSGVHANMFCCNMRTEKEVDADRFKRSLNAVLPDSVAVINVKEVNFDFHARYNCVGKQYKYLIWNADYKNPFYINKALFYPYNLDVDLLNKVAQDFVGTYDFSAFCAANSSVEDKTRTVKSISLERKGDMVEFYIEADGFLYNMVRIIVGTLLDINYGKIDKNSIKTIINSRDRLNAGQTAPAQGLYLNKVFY